MFNKVINILFDDRHDRSYAKKLLKPHLIFTGFTVIGFILSRFNLGLLTEDVGFGVILSFLAYNVILMLTRV